MKNWAVVLFLLFFVSVNSYSQNTLSFFVKDSLTGNPLFGAVVKVDKTSIGGAADFDGRLTLKNVPVGNYTFSANLIGYKKQELNITVPSPDSVIVISLASANETIEEVNIVSTRTNSRIEDLPIKVEVLGIDDMEEENGIKPGNVTSILGDLSIIHIQQTSQVNGNAAVRMQGLDGKYTQLLRDGLPLYEGFSGSFGVLQLPPLDLKQVEIIKGSVSTLYGGGAISGMINLISKAPADSTEASLTLNQSTLKESNVNAYYAKKLGKVGLSCFAGTTLQRAVDVNKDGFSDVPEITNTLIHPKIFFYLSDRTNLNIGLSSLYENRLGGDMQVITYRADSVHTYYERNKSNRNTVDVNFNTRITDKQTLTIKGTATLFNRLSDQSGFLFNGRQISTYSEANYLAQLKRHSLVGGVNFITEQFVKKESDSTAIHNYYYQTIGLFLQDGWQLHPKFLIEAGVRADRHNKYGWFILPRLAILYKPHNNLSIRLSSGEGYKTPNIFTQQTLSGSFRNLLPIDNTVKAERSVGANADINYHTVLFNEVSMNINQAFYYTIIYNPIIATTSGQYANLTNAAYNIQSKGTDTYIRFSWKHLELYVGYNHTIARHYDGNKDFVLFSPQDKFSSTLAYEIENKWRFGIENSSVANQYINATQKARNYWFWAAMVEKKFKHFSIVLNCENLFDVRQSRFESIVIGSTSAPQFKGLYAPIDGRIVNLSVRVKL